MGSNLNLSKSNVNKINPNPTGVDPEEDPSAFVFVYPVPSSGELNVQCSMIHTGSAELLDLMGKRLLAKELDRGSLNLDISSQPDGIYFLRIKGSSGEVVTKKIVVQK